MFQVWSSKISSHSLAMGKKAEWPHKVSVNALLHRQCSCLDRMCLQQFAGCEGEVQAARDRFHNMDGPDKAP